MTLSDYFRYIILPFSQITNDRGSTVGQFLFSRRNNLFDQCIHANIMSLRPSIKVNIITRYIGLIREFFEEVQKSVNILQSASHVHSLMVGVSVIHRVFEHVLFKTQNVENAYYYSQKTYAYYLEYMEQVIASQLSGNLNHMDAVLFIYNKTIFELENPPVDTMANILSLGEKSWTADPRATKEFFALLFNSLTVFFYWDNQNITLSDRIELCKETLYPFLIHADTMPITIRYIEILQEKTQMGISDYTALLQEILHKWNGHKKIRDFLRIDANQVCLTKFFVEETEFYAKLQQGDLRELVEWLYSIG